MIGIPQMAAIIGEGGKLTEGELVSMERLVERIRSQIGVIECAVTRDERGRFQRANQEVSECLKDNGQLADIVEAFVRRQRRGTG